MSSISWLAWVLTCSSSLESWVRAERLSLISFTCSSSCPCSRTRSVDDSAISAFLSSSWDMFMRMVFSRMAMDCMSARSFSSSPFFSWAMDSSRFSSF